MTVGELVEKLSQISSELNTEVIICRLDADDNLKERPIGAVYESDGKVIIEEDWS